MTKHRDLPPRDFPSKPPRDFPQPPAPAPAFEFDLKITDSCEICGSHKWTETPEGKFKCRNCGHLVDNKIRSSLEPRQ